jgi:class 3 adenylate cyclase
MHSQLRELLRCATGESSFVVASNIDIRGFSSFFSDSSQAAAFLSSAYTRILDDYFPDVSFFKPTGDGLLIVKAVDRESLTATVQRFVAGALRLDSEFKDVCAADDLINFRTPERVGIGIARGTATRISAEDKTLDFSGYPLNLASRLMDLARPGGVVFDESLGLSLLTSEQEKGFRPEKVYVKGLADLSPITAYVTADVDIPAGNKRPFGAEIYVQKAEECTYTEFKRYGPRFLHRLDHRPLSSESVRLHFQFPSTDERGVKIGNILRTHALPALSVEEQPDGLVAVFDYEFIQGSLDRFGIKGPWTIRQQLSYSVPVGTVPSGQTLDEDAVAEQADQAEQAEGALDLK